jgi:hypothetical protein
LGKKWLRCPGTAEEDKNTSLLGGIILAFVFGEPSPKQGKNDAHNYHDNERNDIVVPGERHRVNLLLKMGDGGKRASGVRSLAN